MADWQPVTGWPARTFRRCAACGGQEEREPTLQGYHGWSEKLERACGAPEPREGILAPPGAQFLGGIADPTRRYPWFAMRYPLRQADGSIAVETMQFPIAETGFIVDPTAADGAYDLGRSKKRVGVGGQVFE